MQNVDFLIDTPGNPRLDFFFTYNYKYEYFVALLISSYTRSFPCLCLGVLLPIGSIFEKHKANVVIIEFSFMFSMYHSSSHILRSHYPLHY